jgi:multidrug efflux pump subunit AcrA (membrane-fusion protein)
MTRSQLATTLTAIFIALALGWWGNILFTGQMEAQGGDATPPPRGPCPDGAEPLYWKAPMDPSYVRDGPGKSPMGMDLVPECGADTGEAPEGSVVVDSATLQNIGVRTTTVRRRDLTHSIRAVGRVAYDERRVTHVHTKVQGWVERLMIDFVGQEVKQGEPLLEIYSPELVATQEELLLAARYEAATAKSPFDDVRGGGRSLLEATKRRLALWDIPERDVEALLETGEAKRTLTVYAPASGVVTRLGVRAGMEVEPNTNLYTIADLSKVWVLAEVYEFELPWLALGQPAEVRLSYRPGERMQGVLTYIAPFLDPETRTVEVRLELDNSAGRLKPEMFGNAVIAGTSHPDVLAVPSDAVIRSGTRNLAIVSLGEGRFEPREIALGLDSGDGWLEVLSGLEDGEEVVVSSQFLIDSESNLQEAANKLLAGHARSPEARSDHSAHEKSPPSTPEHKHPSMDQE